MKKTKKIKKTETRIKLSQKSAIEMPLELNVTLEENKNGG